MPLGGENRRLSRGIVVARTMGVIPVSASVSVEVSLRWLMRVIGRPI